MFHFVTCNWPFVFMRTVNVHVFSNNRLVVFMNEILRSIIFFFFKQDWATHVDQSFPHKHGLPLSQSEKRDVTNSVHLMAHSARITDCIACMLLPYL